MSEEPSPPKRKMVIEGRTPQMAVDDATELRRQLIEAPESEREQIADEIAQCVSIYGDIGKRLSELRQPKSNKTEAQSRASCAEYNALIRLNNNKTLTSQYADKLSGAALTVAYMSGGNHLGVPIDLKELTSQIQAQMEDLKSSGETPQGSFSSIGGYVPASRSGDCLPLTSC